MPLRENKSWKLFLIALGAAACATRNVTNSATDQPGEGIVAEAPAEIRAPMTPPSDLSAELLVTSEAFDWDAARAAIDNRIKSGVYDGYVADLCVDDVGRCRTPELQPFWNEQESAFQLKLSRKRLSEYTEAVRREAYAAIVYYAWGHPTRRTSALRVTSGGKDLAQILPADVQERYMRFAYPSEIEGGLGLRSYAPNCWFTSISTVAAITQRGVTDGGWRSGRFMGPAEFRAHMGEFEEVQKPEFGDVVRYYATDPIYVARHEIYSGEIHAAVFVGRARTGSGEFRDIVLTKNGRNDHSQLQFQFLDGLDALYLAPLPENDPLRSKYDGVDPRRRTFFRLRIDSQLPDPDVVDGVFEARIGRDVDRLNYQGRWTCLESDRQSTECYALPTAWRFVGTAHR